MTTVLEIRNLNKSFDGICVADDINLSLSAGRVLGLIGPNGAGKTSLFNLAFGNVKPDSGSILLNGKSLDGMTPHQRARCGLSRTWQHVRLFPSLSVLDNILIGGKGYPGEHLTQVLFRPGHLAAYMKDSLGKAYSILERCGLGSAAEQTLADLPYGRQKLVGVARALMNDAQCLLLDEPMAGVEGQLYSIMQRVVRDLAEAGVAVGVVEHNVAFIRDLCDEGVFMFAGKILARGAVSELIADNQLTELYFGT